MKKKLQKIKLSRETLGQLGDSAVQQVAGGQTEETCSYCGICRTDDPCCSGDCPLGNQ